MLVYSQAKQTGSRQNVNASKFIDANVGRSCLKVIEYRGCNVLQNRIKWYFEKALKTICSRVN